jgi:uncharacterized protein YegJ (DUF2314 family)
MLGKSTLTKQARCASKNSINFLRINSQLARFDDGQRSTGTLVMKYLSILALVFFIGSTGCEKPKPETLVESGYDEKEMDAAIERARSEVDSFVTELSNPTGTDHSVKAPIEDAGETEHFWLIDVTFQNGEFKGTIGNDPGIVSNVTYGQSWTIKKADISDWMFMRDGKMHGNYTMRPLLKTMPEDEATMYREMLANP